MSDRLYDRRHPPLVMTDHSHPVRNDYEPYRDKITKDNCQLCVKSNPDVSRTSTAIKSCLKKPKVEISSSNSLPSMENILEEKKVDLTQVNREWNRAYETEPADRVLTKISDDLDFLLNRTQEKCLDNVEIEPT